LLYILPKLNYDKKCLYQMPRKKLEKIKKLENRLFFYIDYVPSI
jgi:hypothetical protein